MKKSLLMPLGICCVIFGISCANKPPLLEPCVIINELEAYCVPQDPRKKEYKKFVSNMIGDITLTAKEVADLKKWIKTALEDLRFQKLEEIIDFHRNIEWVPISGKSNSGK